MAKKPKRKLTAAERRAKKARKAAFEMVFINGKQRMIRRPPMIDGMSEEEFFEKNASPLDSHQHEMWEGILTLNSS